MGLGGGMDEPASGMARRPAQSGYFRICGTTHPQATKPNGGRACLRSWQSLIETIAVIFGAARDAPITDGVGIALSANIQHRSECGCAHQRRMRRALLDEGEELAVGARRPRRSDRYQLRSAGRMRRLQNR